MPKTTGTNPPLDPDPAVEAQADGHQVSGLKQRPARDAAVAVNAAELHDLVEAAAPHAKKDSALAAALAPFQD